MLRVQYWAAFLLFSRLNIKRVSFLFFIKNFFRENIQQYIPDVSGLNFAIGGIIYIAGALIYMFRIPERFVPVKFDKLMSSHQIMHVFVLIAASIHFYGSF